MSYKAVIFDLDGTILDTLQDLANSVNHALRTHGYPERTVDEVRRFIGNGIRVLMRRSCPAGISEEAQEAALATFRVHYDAHCKDFTAPYDGIRELLNALREQGIRTAVVSNKIEPAVIVLCDEHFPGQFEYMVGNRPDLAPKPAPDSVNEVIEKMGLERKDIVDIQTSDNAGLDCIGVEWGFRDGAYLRELGAKYIVEQPMDVLDIVL